MLQDPAPVVPGPEIEASSSQSKVIKSLLISSQTPIPSSDEQPQNKISSSLFNIMIMIPKKKSSSKRRQAKAHASSSPKTKHSLQFNSTATVKYRHVDSSFPPTSYRKTQKRKIPQTLRIALQTADPIFSAVGKFTLPYHGSSTFGSASLSGAKFLACR